MGLIARMSRWQGLCGMLFGLVWSAAAFAMENGPTLSDYNRAVWTASDGAPLHVRSITQTPDGWLWLGTDSDLYRFDGVRFHPVAATNGARLLNSRGGGGSVIFDRGGNLWALRCPTGFCLAASARTCTSASIDVAEAATSRLDRLGQLSSLAPAVVG